MKRPPVKQDGIRSIADLTPDPHNARRRTQRSLGMIEKSLREVGAARSIVIDEDGKVLAGNGTIEAAGLAGIDRVRVVDADGDEIIAVRRTGLTSRQKTRLALFDNRTAELAEWDFDEIAALDELDLEGMELAPIGDRDGTGEWAGMPAFNQEDKTAFRSIVLHFKDAKAMAEFEERYGRKISDKARYLWFPEIEIEPTADIQYSSVEEDAGGEEK